MKELGLVVLLIYICLSCRLNNWQCERFCVDIPTQDDTVVTMAGDTIVSATCRRAHNARTGQLIWAAAAHPATVLVSSCTR